MCKSKKIFWLFLAPCLITFCIAVVIPTITGIYYSFTDWDDSIQIVILFFWTITSVHFMIFTFKMLLFLLLNL